MKAFYQGISYKFIDYSFSIRANTEHQSDFLFEDQFSIRASSEDCCSSRANTYKYQSSARELFYGAKKQKNFSNSDKKVENISTRAKK